MRSEDTVYSDAGREIPAVQSESGDVLQRAVQQKPYRYAGRQGHSVRTLRGCLAGCRHRVYPALGKLQGEQ